MVAGAIEEMLRQRRPLTRFPGLRVDDGDGLTARVQFPRRGRAGQSRTDDDDPLAHVSMLCLAEAAGWEVRV